MGWARVSVGAVLMAIPRLVLGISGREESTATEVLLLRTIGIRDVVIGAGVVAAARSGDVDELHRWTRTALVSDSLDVAASVAASRSIGTRDAAAAALTAVLAALGDLHVLRGLGAAESERQPDAR